MPNSRLKQLLSQYLKDQISPDELRELQRLIITDTNAQELDDLLQDAYSNPEWATLGDYDREQVYRELLAKMDSKKEDTTSVISFTASKRRWIVYRRIAAAAAIVLVVGAGTYFTFFKNRKEAPVTAVANPVVPADVKAPQTNRATITLGNGKTIFLDSVGNGTLATQNNIRIIKTANGELVYESSKSSSPLLRSVVYNTLSNPRGSQVITMTLSDGSRVWLNAGSSIKYPVAFPASSGTGVGSERKVSITGEAYFEVKHNESRPFRVSTISPSGGEGADITVLGTHFNVNAYNDESSIKVTLLEGSVKVTSPSPSESPDSYREGVRLIPGQQARVEKGQHIRVVNDVDIQEVVAWQKGLFVFDNTDLATIMRQVSRWYDVEVVYDGKIADTKFGGGLSKSLPLSNVLKLIEANGVKFKLEGKVLRVIP